MDGLAILLIVILVIGLVATIVSAVCFLVAGKGRELMAVLAGGVIVVSICGYGAYFFTARYYENTFYSHYSDFQTARSAVGVTEQKAGETRPELLALIDQLVDLDSKLTEAVESRPEQLKTLVERYPELRANEKVRELVAKYIGLTTEVADQKLVADAFANAYNKNTGTWPAREFAPHDLPPKLPLYYPTSTE